jgi:hypothetical protein
MRGVLMIVLVSGLASGCAAATHDQLVRRASFDFDCGPDMLRYREIDDRTRGVTGCGKRATYVESCDGPREKANTSCTWILNGEIEKPQRAKAGLADPEPPADGDGSGSRGESPAPR